LREGGELSIVRHITREAEAPGKEVEETGKLGGEKSVDSGRSEKTVPETLTCHIVN
jgi:hypothetical protein